jgi:RasGEF domain/RasGEF N-terminal motif
LTRESPRIQGNDLLRRNRKALLSELSSLVKTAKRLQEFTSNSSMQDSEEINDLLDEMVLKAFKIITRAVKFLDVLEDDKRTSQLISRAISAVNEEAYIPPTPPADSTSFEQAVPASDAGSRRTSNRSSATDISGSHAPEEYTKRHSLKRMSCLYPSGQNSARPISIQLNRLSVSHRVSTAGSLLSRQRVNFISERLSSSHDTLLSYLGSFIGRLHLQSQSSADLLLTIGQSISAGRSLLTLIEAVCAHDAQSEGSLMLAKDIMYHCINQLILAARECVRPAGSDEDGVIMPQENARLKDAATDCVVAAGECVAKTKFVIERIGDFELDSPGQEIGTDLATFKASPNIDEIPTILSEHTQLEPMNRPPPPLVIPCNDKPLPMVPEASLLTSHRLPQHSDDVIVDGPTDNPGRSSTISLLPPLPNLTSPLLPQDEYSPSEHSTGPDGDLQSSFRSGSVAVSTSGTSSTYLSGIRDSESSMVSQTSTRATTPDVSPYTPSHQSSFSNLSNTESQTTLAEDAEDAESKVLEKTYAHELLYNKEGQITGGTLPALVERLTTHDSTPDAMFVSTFYLTFRLFVTPIKLAEALVDRFDYVAESPHIAGPVRLRVYNVLKGWLESHWRDLSDHDALAIIEPFAQDKLCSVLPAAGRRLLELARKVSSIDGPLVPRLVSSMGKTSTSIAQYVPPDTPLPAPLMSKSQTNALKNWKMGGSPPTILEFDPLELARQFTIKEMNIFCSILPEELLASEWMKKSGSNAVNVRAMSTLSTDLSNLVADTILQYEDAKKRATVIKHWIKIAQKCLELNNYDSLMAIICSLNSSTIMRLRKTWDIVSQKRKDILKTLQDIVEPTKNHAVLRQRLHDHVPPCLPFVGTYLTDLTFVDIGNPAEKQLPGIGGKVGLSVINFDKHTRTAKIIGELQRFQIPYRLTEVPEIQEWIQAQIVRVRCSNDQNNVQQYYRKSLLLEPRANCPRISPTDSLGNFPMGTKDKFDLFSWTHSREKTATTAPATPIPV